MDDMPDYVTHSADETTALGYRIGQALPDNSIVCFFGDLAAGKTTLIKGIAEACSYPLPVSSPTFVYLHIYQGARTLYHFDLYRLRNPDEFLAMGFDDHLFAGGVCCIEWSERISNLLPQNCTCIHMAHLGEGIRKIRVTQCPKIL